MIQREKQEEQWTVALHCEYLQSCVNMKVIMNEVGWFLNMGKGQWLRGMGGYRTTSSVRKWFLAFASHAQAMQAGSEAAVGTAPRSLLTAKCQRQSWAGA